MALPRTAQAAYRVDTSDAPTMLPGTSERITPTGVNANDAGAEHYANIVMLLSAVKALADVVNEEAAGSSDELEGLYYAAEAELLYYAAELDLMRVIRLVAALGPVRRAQAYELLKAMPTD